MRNYHFFAVLFMFGLVSGFGCSELGDETPSGNINSAVSVSAALMGATHDVGGFLYEVQCEDNNVLTEYVPLQSMYLPAWLDSEDSGDTHYFADLYYAVAPGDCSVVATPYQDENTPSTECHPASAFFTVVSEHTTEIILVSQCDADPNGAFDIITELNTAPVIDSLQFDSSKFAYECAWTTLTAAASDPDGDNIHYTWEVIGYPMGAVYHTEFSDSPVAKVMFETIGSYELRLSVVDEHAGTVPTTLTFPMHIADDPNVESCTPTCANNDDCEDAEFCALDEPETCGGDGMCSPRPGICPFIYAPVCGCDEMTYSNECVAWAAGVNVAATGECPGPMVCTSNDECEATEYCALDEPETCGGDGMCTPRPSICLFVYDPVCGCDEMTYSNECVAQAAGVNVAATGECPGPMVCTSNDECEATEYCALDEPETCGGDGMCSPRPGICSLIFDPVCGCDEETYSNECNAWSAGVNVAATGECPQLICTTNDECEATEYCALDDPETCGGGGMCSPRPGICSLIFDPVCGCDEETYSNECNAWSAGVNVAATGECPQLICTTNDECEATEYCALDEPETCGGEGMCTPRPGICSLIFDPVCGCDEETYSNECVAWSAGVNVAATGECPGPMVCTSNDECEATEYCALDEPETCGGDGMCSPRPGICSLIFDPVCGCDEETYSNECNAWSAGVNVAATGECPQLICTTNDECEATEYCALDDPETCGGEGMCSPRPGICSLIFDPVCGCDEETYSNECNAWSAGVNVAATGECAGPLVCNYNSDCLEGEYCAGEGCSEDLSSCDPFLPEGICQPKVDEAECVGAPVEPVCGCNSVFYLNPCSMEAAGARYRSDGICPPAPCPGGTDAECPCNHYCLVAAPPASNQCLPNAI